MMKVSSHEHSFYWNTIAVRNISLEENGDYRVELGISAQFFFLKRKVKKEKKIRQDLQFSLVNSEKIKIKIETGTNQILDSELILKK
jgi:hypothetical protein